MLPSHSALMEVQGSKGKRVYPFEPNMVDLLANFSHKFLAHLLPVLIKIGRLRSRGASKEEEVEKIVMFQVKMALVASASGFGWSRALRQKLERGMKVRKFHSSMARRLAACSLSSTCEQKNALDMKELWALPPIPRPLAPTHSHMDAKPNLSKHKAVKPIRRIRGTSGPKKKLSREDENLHGRIRTLRRILPGGNGMGVNELLSEVGSYAICLELQVNVLRSLLGAQCLSL